MTSREKLKKSLSHQNGPIPVDFGSNAVTGMHVSIVAQLREYYGLESCPVKVVEPYQMLGEVDAELKSAVGIDVTGVFPYHTMFGFPLENWKEWRTPWGQEVLVPGNFNTKEEGGDLVIFPEGDISAPPSGRMPEGGFFFDSIIRQPPIVEEELDPRDNTEEFPPISEAELDYYERECRGAAETDLGIIANFGGTAIGDISGVPGPGLKHPKGIRDVTEWYMSTLMRPDYLHEVFQRQTDVAVANLQKIFARVGNTPDAVFVCGTDFGTQDSQFCSVDTFRRLYTPYYKRINGWIHESTEWKTFKHSCGAVEPFMKEFIDAGFDIINPVQISAAGMDARPLKEKYGDYLVFWGGGVDTQKTLPFGTPDEVRSEVTERLEILSAGGGYVFNAIHNVQAKTPLDNVVTMLKTVAELNKS
ncbi:MAG: uroporphyrinogen decarboxylase family protein [Spirochaetaceae bacterium]|nr:uroporphyrinogen decarboxylase family protein [Spirochaetaceae bacterium]